MVTMPLRMTYFIPAYVHDEIEDGVEVGITGSEIDGRDAIDANAEDGEWVFLDGRDEGEADTPALWGQAEVVVFAGGIIEEYDDIPNIRVAEDGFGDDDAFHLVD